MIVLPGCVFGSALQDSLYVDIDDGSLDRFSPIEAAFIISGVATPDSLSSCISWFQMITEDIENKRLMNDLERTASAEKVFLYLHTTCLLTYKIEATTLLHIKQNREFNCVSATILYNLICDEVGLSTMAFETPTHVYTIFSNFTENIMVENTTTMGFNIIKNLDRYSRYMAQYYPTAEIYKIGLHRLYAHENSRGRQISNVELLGLISYNQAYFAAKDSSYQQAYEYVLLAQKFNKDSRSNQRFEFNLYYTWGKQLFDQKNYCQAFEVFADAYYRYPDNSDFKKNCNVSFFREIDQLWTNKDWEKTMNIFFEISDTDILSDADVVALSDTISRWIHYFYLSKQKKQGLEAVELLRDMSDDSQRVLQMEKLINSL